MKALTFQYHDGGRKASGFQGDARDCVTRSIALATEAPYLTVYEALNDLAKKERPRGVKARSSARTGVHRTTYEAYLKALGWTWTPTMQIGHGCTVRLRADELPPGRLVVAVSRHLTCVVDGTVYDTHDPSRDGTRCVYGYYRKG